MEIAFKSDLRSPRIPPQSLTAKAACLSNLSTRFFFCRVAAANLVVGHSVTHQMLAANRVSTHTHIHRHTHTHIHISKILTLLLSSETKQKNKTKNTNTFM